MLPPDQEDLNKCQDFLVAFLSSRPQPASAALRSSPTALQDASSPCKTEKKWRKCVASLMCRWTAKVGTPVGWLPKADDQLGVTLACIVSPVPRCGSCSGCMLFCECHSLLACGLRLAGLCYATLVAITLSFERFVHIRQSWWRTVMRAAIQELFCNPMRFHHDVLRALAVML